jgi:Flp pilus assembly protein TadG
MTNLDKSSHRAKSYLHRDKGIVSVEFALMFPIFLLLLFAAYELGIYLHDKQVVTYAAREATRFGSTMQNPRPGESDIRDKVVEYSTTLITGDLNNNCAGETDSVIISVEDDNWISGNDLTIRVCTPFPFPLLSNFSGFAEVPLFAQAVMVLE